MDLLKELKQFETQFSVVKIGSANLSNLSKIRDSFGFSTNEIILAYIPNRNFITQFISDATFVVTDVAVYKKRSVIGRFFGKNSDNKVVDIESLSKYIAYVENFSVMLKAKDEERTFFENSLLDTLTNKDDALYELNKVIFCIQQEQCKNEGYKKKRDDTVKWVEELVENDFAVGTLQESTLKMVDVLKNESNYASEMYSFLLNDSIIKCDTLLFENYAADSIKFLADDEVKKLETLAYARVTDLLSKLENVTVENTSKQFKAKYELILSNDKQRKNSELLPQNIGLFAAIRNNLILAEAYILINYNPQIESNIATDRLVNIPIDNKRIARLINISGYLKNRSMAVVFDKINKGHCEEVETGWTDVLGLNPLYYAIATKKQEAIVECIRSANKLPGYDYEFDYCTAAMYVGLSDETIKEIFMATDMTAQNCQKSIEVIDLKISVMQKLISMASVTVDTQRKIMQKAKADGDFETFEKCKEELYKYREKVEQAEEEIKEFYRLREEIECEMEDEFEEKRKQCQKNIENIRNSSDVKLKIMKYILDKPESIGSYLNASIDDYVCFIVSNHFYSMPKFLYKMFYRNISLFDTESDCEFYWEKSQSAKEEKVEKAYGESWFSPLAHSNIRTLQSEYRLLAKKYHPDNFGGRHDVFVEIQIERNEIICNLTR